MLNLQINGDHVEIPKTVSTVSQLLEHFELGEKVLIVEHNQNIIEKASHAETSLTNGDRIEIVHFVGGG